MTPAARVQAAIEVLGAVIAAARGQGAPADRLIADWFRAHRFAGSKDKRAIRELVYDAVRACGPVPASGRAAMLRLAEEQPELAALFDGSSYGPAPIGADERPAEGGIAPEWLEDRLIAAGVDEAEAVALLARAPLDTRINRLKLAGDFRDFPEAGEPLAGVTGMRFAAGTQIAAWQAYEDGLIEVQDHGSQLACAAVGAQPGECVIDLCAGAGGKTLALAAAMDNRGTLVVADTDRRRLSQLGPRATRAGAQIAAEVLLDPGKELESLKEWHGQADRVLVDAPCSGTGTWRRNPEARWRLTARELQKLVNLQTQLLEIAKELVKPGGTIAYVTCSLLDEEGAGQIAAFLQRNPAWQAQALDLPLGMALGQVRGPGVRLTPSRDGTDGFFIARLSRP